MLRALFIVALALGASGCLAFHTGAMAGEPRDATFLRLRGARVRYVDEGPPDAPAVVLIHGFAASLDTWEPIRRALRGRYRVLALDLRGFGWTDRPAGDYSPEEQARLVLALMDARGVRSAAVVAHSYGGSVALALALAAPARVARLAIYDGWAYASQLPTFFHMARADGVGEALFAGWYGERTEDRIALAFYDERYVTMRLVDATERALARPGTTAAALAAVRAMHYERLEPRYHEVRQPTLLMWGREDRVTPLAIGERLAGDLPGARLVVYPRCGHFPMIEREAQSTAELVRFLDAGAAVATPVAPPITPSVAGPVTP